MSRIGVRCGMALKPKPRVDLTERLLMAALVVVTLIQAGATFEIIRRVLM